MIGAGASADLELPLGTQLRDKIAELLVPIARGEITSEATNVIWETLRRRARSQSTTDNGQHYRRAAAEMSSHIRLVRSIDEFIDHHSGDHHIEFVAKVAICWLILEAESKSSLLRGSSHARSLNLPKMQQRDAWLLELWNLMRVGTHVGDPRAVFQNLSFIVFNYDRCLEVFLTQALMSLFRVPEPEARTMVDEVPILHPYGRVGSPDDRGARFGALEDISTDKLAQLAQSIRTFGESERDEQLSAKLRDVVTNATNIVFIGFAFHDANMDFFECSRGGDWPKVYASACGLPPEHWPDIRVSLIKKMATPAVPAYQFEPVFRDCKGADLLRIYDKPLRR